MVLYHYCTNATLISILESREIRASWLTLSNDHMEGRWIREVFLELCKDRKVLSHHTDRMLIHLENLSVILNAAGVCLSSKGDLLSQWRGYAENGAGVSIGFSKEYLDHLGTPGSSLSLQKVEYEVSKQKERISGILDQLLEEVGKGAFESAIGTLLVPISDEEKRRNEAAFFRLGIIFLQMFGHIHVLKNPAFEEESEWRLIATVITPPEDLGSNGLTTMDFYPRHDRIVPFRKIPFTGEWSMAIKEVILGPRNITPEPVVAAALFRYGFKEVKVRRSKASFR